MATTVTKKYDGTIGSIKMQIYRIAAGASDTSATFKTGLASLVSAHGQSQDDSSCGIVINSNDGTEGSSKGDVYLAGVINSAKLEVVVWGF